MKIKLSQKLLKKLIKELKYIMKIEIIIKLSYSEPKPIVKTSNSFYSFLISSRSHGAEVLNVEKSPIKSAIIDSIKS